MIGRSHRIEQPQPAGQLSSLSLQTFIPTTEARRSQRFLRQLFSVFFVLLWLIHYFQIDLNLEQAEFGKKESALPKMTF
jgi:hypothetical protein